MKSPFAIWRSYDARGNHADYLRWLASAWADFCLALCLACDDARPSIRMSAAQRHVIFHHWLNAGKPSGRPG